MPFWWEGGLSKVRPIAGSGRAKVARPMLFRPLGIYMVVFYLDWLKSLKQFFINVSSYTCSQSNSDGSVLKPGKFLINFHICELYLRYI